MKILLQAVRIIDSNSPYHGKVRDILVQDGNITDIATDLKKKKVNKTLTGIPCVSPGWLDLFACFNDPGFEYKEDLESGMAAAAAGGFTTVACMPNSKPPIDSKANVSYVTRKTEGSIVDVLPIGAVSQDLEGAELTEMYDMKESGAAAFTNAFQRTTNAGMMQRALFYVKPFNGVILSHPEDRSLSKDSQVNEGLVSTQLGLKGNPSLAEELVVARDIALAEYTGSRLHFLNISTGSSVDMVRQAKKKGLPVTASVTAYHLLLDDSIVSDYDTNYKVNPPLRTKEDIKALQKGLLDGTIDAVCSQHIPQDEESKKSAFEYAEFGMIGLETSFAVLQSALGKKVAPETLIQKLSAGPRAILDLPPLTIDKGQVANLTLFDPDRSWVFEKSHIRSKSVNTPFIGQEFTGRVLGVINNNQFYLN